MNVAPAPRRLLLLAGAGALAAAVAGGLRPRRVVVEGPSMEPTLTGGDRLLVLRRRRPRAGEIVAVRDPRPGGRLLVKRVVSVLGGEVLVAGDNRPRSTDSRDFGPLGRRALVGRVVYRYGPVGRSGWLLGDCAAVGKPGALQPGGRRRARYAPGVTSLDRELQRLFASDYLDDVDKRSLGEVRAMRADCQEAETVLSYVRRVAQGRLDIVHSFLDHRDTGQSVGDLAGAVEDLSSIIGAGPARPSGNGRLPSQMSPDMESVDLTREIDDVLDARGIGQLPTMSEADLTEIAGRLTVIEARVSDQRRTLHERIDALQAEIVSRYKTGKATVDGLLS